MAYVRNENRGDHGIEEQIDTIRALSDYSGHEPYSNEERRVIRLWNLNNEFSGTLAPVLAIPQYPDSSRADNFVFKRFGYWFALPAVAWEKNYMLAYDSIAEGYRRDEIRPFLTNFFSLNRSSDENDNRRSVSLNTLSDFVDYLNRQGKRIIFVYGPPSDSDMASWDVSRTHMGLRFQDRAEFVGPENIFPAGDSSEFYVDGQHYSRIGNEAVAKALAPLFAEE